ncbi:MAG: prolyl oligopeptidase family serine peptidase [Armatimonadetes bacterium]|nr:prolyl oligopeptidase family serine peptidase [Armatimonadota bacterium]
MNCAILPLIVIGLLAFPQQAVDPAQELASFERELSEAAKLRDDSDSFATNYPLARLALKKAHLAYRQNALFPTPVSLEAILQTGREALHRLRVGQVWRATPGRLNELAYGAANDGSVQPYYLYLPPKFDPARKWPLIVFLHGYVPTISVLEPWILPEDVCDVAGRNGCLLLMPYGRRNTDFQGVGEVDVLETLALVERYYPVDRSRVYISGVSMGGMGAWNMAFRHPGLFAAATPIAGQTDMLTWWQWPRDQVAPFKKWLIEWDNPVDLVMNAFGLPVFVQHGADDPLIPAEQSRAIVRLAENLGMKFKYYEYQGEGHFIYWRAEPFEKAWTWQKQFALGEPPRRIDYKTYSLEYDRAWWARVDRLAHWGKPAVIKVRADEARRRVTVETQNVAAFALNIKQGKLADDASFVVNGKPRSLDRRQGPWASFDLVPPGTTGGFPPLKRKGLCGPVEEVFDTPFLLVQGTAGDQKADADLAGKVGLWAAEWDAFADGRPRIRLDSEVTAADMEKYNLVLFGTPKTNSALARIAEALPVGIGDHEYRVGEKTFAGPQLGLVMCYPNPLAPHHYVAIYAGEYYGKKLSVNHKHDLLPDFLIFRGDRFLYDDTNEWVCGGFFDSAWKLSSDTTWTNLSAAKAQ